MSTVVFRPKRLVNLVAMASVLAALSACSSAGGASAETSAATSTAFVAPTSPTLLTPSAPEALVPTPAWQPSPVVPDALQAAPEPQPTTALTESEALTRLIGYSIGVAAYAPFNQDAQQDIGPFFFGSDEATQQSGFDCYQQRRSELIDFEALRRDAAEVIGGYFEVPPDAALSARRAAADCISAEDYRRNWIDSHVWGWNTYGRDQSTPPLEPTDPCFAPVYDTPEDFVDAVVAGTLEWGEGHIGPFACIDPAG